MADHCEECSSDVTFENLTCSVQIYWGCTGTSFEVVSLALSNFL